MTHTTHHTGYYHFVDRIGDTFRWHGENVSTTECAEIYSVFPGVEECNVVGVLIENNKDGRAPMAAITPMNGDIRNLDMVKFLAHCRWVLCIFSHSHKHNTHSPHTLTPHTHPQQEPTIVRCASLHPHHATDASDCHAQAPKGRTSQGRNRHCQGERPFILLGSREGRIHATRWCCVW